jgi:hypothetical protein
MNKNTIKAIGVEKLNNKTSKEPLILILFILIESRSIIPATIQKKGNTKTYLNEPL